MHPVAIFSAVVSRLQADLVVIRLRRAGVSRGTISAAFPEPAKPNCALCWLDGQSSLTLYNGKTVTVAGTVGERISVQSEPTFIGSLQDIGLNLNDACSYLDRLNNGQIIVSVSSNDDAEIALAWQAMSELKADHIALELSAAPGSSPHWSGLRSAPSTRRSSSHRAAGLKIAM